MPGWLLAALAAPAAPLRTRAARGLILAAGLPLAPDASARILTVDGSGIRSIEEAVSLAETGDEIELEAGDWPANVTITKDLTIRGSFGARIVPVRGVAISVAEGVSLTLSSVVLDGDGSRTCLHTAGTVIAVDTTFSGCSSTGKGSAIFVDEAATFIGERVLVEGSAASSGPMWLSAGATATLTDSLFRDGVAETGGAIASDAGATLETVRTEFRANQAGSGGAVRLVGSVWQSSGDSFTANFASQGGAITLSEFVDATFSGATFTANLATFGDGGAIFAETATYLGITNSTFTQSTSSNAGGHLSALFTPVDLRNVVMTNGSARDGGAIYALDGRLDATGVDFGGNTATASGGAVYAFDAGNLNLRSCDLHENIAGFRGGALFVAAAADGAVNVLESRIIGNQASDVAGAAWIEEFTGAVTTIESTLLHANTGVGGTLTLHGSSRSGAFHLTGNQFCGNQVSVSPGSAFQAFGATLFASNNAIWDNAGAGSGHVLRAENSTVDIRQNTLAGNDGSTLEVIRFLDSSGTFAANIATANTGSGLVGSFSTISGTNNALGNTAFAGATLTAAISGAPNLAGWNSDNDCTNDRMWLSPTSPMRDRNITGVDPDGSLADLGAYGGVNGDATPPHVWTTDNDGDGLVTVVDCDDSNTGSAIGGAQNWYVDSDDDGLGTATSTPVRSCTDVAGRAPNNEDCDDTVDGIGAGGSTWFLDNDGDGYGTFAYTACGTPSGYAPLGGDCDDTDGAENPGVTWYIDSDGDGWGGFGQACERPSATAIPIGGDCDDGNAFVHPDSDDTFIDGVDQDCDGAEWCFVDSDGDGYGGTTVALGPINCIETGWSPNADDCDDLDAEEFPGQVWYADADGDGFGGAAMTGFCARQSASDVPFTGDCDPTNAGVYPAATYWADEDGDGFGDGNQPFQPRACGLPADHATNADDCDDLDPDVQDFPFFFEDVDRDGHGDPAGPTAACVPVGTIDAELGDDCNDADPTLYPGAVWYVDGDGDGYGDDDDAFLLTSCLLPADVTPTGGDCDDSDASEHPGVTWFTDADGDGWGVGAGLAGCRGAASDVSFDGDCDDNNAARSPGAVEVVGNLVDEDCSGAPDCYLDLDGDGYGDGAVVASLDASCDPAQGEAENLGDCAPENSAIHPGATETRGDGIDSNCSCDLPGDDGSDFGYGCGDPTSDDDGDGLSFETEQALGTSDDAGDTDGDGLRDDIEVLFDLNPRDVDSDGDGAPDAIEFGPDDTPRNTDGTGLIDALDEDDDDDGVPTAQEGAPNRNTDACDALGAAEGVFRCDTLPDYLDPDDDGDDVPTSAEPGDTVPGGAPDRRSPDDDDDGIPTRWEIAAGADPRDPDSDADTVPDGDEWGDDWTDPRNSDRSVTNDAIDALDEDDDEDGIPTAEEWCSDLPMSASNGPTVDGDCVPDGTPNYLDPDADGDGIADGEEQAGVAPSGCPYFLDCDSANPNADTDCDLILDSRELQNTLTDRTRADSDGDGLPDREEIGNLFSPTNSDGDTAINALDADDDGDGVPTSREIEPRCSDGSAASSLLTGATMCDIDTAGKYASVWACDDGSVAQPRNTDGASNPDYLEVDDDGDGVSTRDEDRDGDGDPFTDDLDGDTFPDFRDDDDDGDGVRTRDELDPGGLTRDGDGDSIPDHLDRDENDGPLGDLDNDGLTNEFERASGCLDAEGTDTDGDGVPDAAEWSDGVDLDEDSVPDACDEDDDGDGLLSSEEGAADADGDGLPDARDPDSDNDGSWDGAESLDDVDADDAPDRFDAGGGDAAPDPTPAPKPGFGGCDHTGDGRFTLAALGAALAAFRRRSAGGGR